MDEISPNAEVQNAVNTPSELSRTQFPEQDENGIDLSLLRANLRLTPTERLEKHQRALELVLEVRRAGKEAGIWHDLSGS